MWNLKNKTNGRNRSISTENKLMVDRGEEDEGIDKTGKWEWEIQASSYGMNKPQG